MPNPDHYATLDLHHTATDAEIKRRYRQIMREVHPDANKDDPAANRKAARVNAAYEILGDPEKRRAYDAQISPRQRDRRYEVWAEAPDWEDIVADHVPPKRPAHKHHPAPTIEPAEIEVDMSELRETPRVKRRIVITNPCACTLEGDVSTSEPWVWGPIGRFTVGPNATLEFDIEVVARKVAFPGISRVQFVTRGWTGTVPVKITGYAPKVRRYVRPTESAFVPSRRRKTMRQF
ncbi:MAG: DnaJ domain-containing protein [Chloroflexi bacterium]|nr:DnaJ domain-containing protein [Chloroflexota bacterium]